MRYFSLFSGIGGFELGFPDEFDCVGYSETNKHALQIYRYHFRTHRNYGDATRIIPRDLPEFDLLVAGFPCQAFSIAGKRLGFKDARGTLFFEIARILRDRRPRYFLLENVGGLLSHAGGETFVAIVEILADIGYRVQWQVLNSKDFGVPQNRERVFIVGHLGEGSRPQIFPLRQGEEDASPQDGGEQTGRQRLSGTISTRCGSLRTGGETYLVRMLTERRTEEAKRIRRKTAKEGRDWSPRRGKKLVARTDGKANCVTAAQGKEGLLAIPEASRTTASIISRPHGFNRGGEREYPNIRDSAIQNELIMRDGRDNRSCLRAGRVPELGIEGMSIRRLTPIECERLQGLPDNWTKQGIDTQGTVVEISDSQRYKCLGNAVSVPVVWAVTKKLVKTQK